MTDKRYRECMAEIIGILQKYDMGGAITVISKERAMFKYHFPTWSVARLEMNKDGSGRVEIESKKEDFPSLAAQHEANELTAHLVHQMRDIALNNVGAANAIIAKMSEVWDIQHKSFADFDPERDQ